MNDLLRWTTLVVALLFTAGNVYLLVRKRLGERTTILWLFGTLLGLLVAAFPGILNRVASTLGVDYPPALLYLVAILVLLTIVLYQSTQISSLEKKLREVTQAVAIMEEDVSALTKTLSKDGIYDMAEHDEQFRQGVGQ